jgi:hypothetical protein
MARTYETPAFAEVRGFEESTNAWTLGDFEDAHSPLSGQEPDVRGRA